MCARMMAWRVHAYGAADSLRLEAARWPTVRAPDHLLVRVRAASLNPLDRAMLDGYGARLLNAARALQGGDGVEFPLVPGRDFVGVVERAGGRARAARGQRVWGVVAPHWAGALADLVVVRDAWVTPAPHSLSDAEAAALPYAGLSACAALRAAGVWPPGERGRRAPRVLLLGLGGVGDVALQLLVQSGAHAVVGCADDLVPRALELGAAAAFDRHAPEYDRQLEECGPYDVVLDCAGAGGWEASTRRSRGARFVTLTSPLLRETDARGLGTGAAAAALSLVAQQAQALSQGGGCVRWAFFSPRTDDLETLRRLADSRKVRPHVERVVGWTAAGEALAASGDRGARGKTIVTREDINSPTTPHTDAC